MTYQAQPRVITDCEREHKYPRVSLMLYRDGCLLKFEGQVAGRQIGTGKCDVPIDGETSVTHGIEFAKLTVLA